MNSLPPTSESWYSKNFLNGGTLNQFLRQVLRQSRIKARIFFHYYLVESLFICQYSLKSSDSRDKNFLDSEHHYNFLNAYGPGLYQIYCKVNNKRYIGESINVLDRLSKHTRDLEKNMSSCYALQKDWNQYSSDSFSATILFVGPAWKDRQDRLTKENELIASYSPEQVYNSHPLKIITNENYRVVCEIHGTRFNSLAEARKKLGESETRIRVKLNNDVPGYKIIEKVKNGYQPIIVNDKVYDSIVAAVAAGEATDRFQAMRRLKSFKYKNWNYYSNDKAID